MGAKKLQMSAQEIVTSYKTAADPKKQIRILQSSTPAPWGRSRRC